jgi:putative oxidoreductase
VGRYALQRLFSTFPDGWPGLGLLLLRAGFSSHLIFIAISDLSSRPSDPAIVSPNFLAVAGGALLLVGLWTPVVGSLVAAAEVWIALSLHSLHQEHMWVHLCLALTSVSLAMLGPGAWSIDARLFGRRRFTGDRVGGPRPRL